MMTFKIGDKVKLKTECFLSNEDLDGLKCNVVYAIRKCIKPRSEIVLLEEHPDWWMAERFECVESNAL